MLRVVDLSAANTITDVAKIGEQNTSYWLLSICRVLVEDPRFTYVGNDPSCEEIPPLRRRFAGGWIILYNGQEQFVQTPIDDETSRISLEEILPAEEIIQRLQSDWRPEDAREDMGAFVRRTVEEARAKAQKELKGLGFDVSGESRSRSVAVTKSWI